MSRDTRAKRDFTIWVALGLVGLAACGLDSGVHPQSDGANGGNGSEPGVSVVSAGGAGAWDASTTLLGTGNDAARGTAGISGMHTGGIDSGGAVSASGGFGGATHAGGAADAGGDGQSGAPDDGENTADAAVLPPLPHALYFSEYVEGSSSNKALEVAASERSSLNGCVIQTYFNGHSDVGASVTLTGELAANTVWTVCSSALASSLGAICAQTANLTFNGNDAIVLACDGTTIDVIGQLGFDPGTYWGTDDTRTADRTLRRLCSTTHGDIIADDAFDPAQEWQGYPIDSFDGLGSLNCDAQTDQ